jgi:hypothetical protein
LDYGYVLFFVNFAILYSKDMANAKVFENRQIDKQMDKPITTFHPSFDAGA